MYDHGLSLRVHLRIYESKALYQIIKVVTLETKVLFTSNIQGYWQSTQIPCDQKGKTETRSYTISIKGLITLKHVTNL